MTAYPIELGDAWWATDGACLVRQGEALPRSYTDEFGKTWPWLASLPEGGDQRFARDALQIEPKQACKAPKVHERFGPLLRSVDHIDAVRIEHAPFERRLVRCWRGGQIVALIACKSDGVRVDALLARETA